MRINLLSFGSLTEIVDSGLIIDSELTDSDSVRNYLLKNHPEIADKKFIMAINKTIVRQNTDLTELDTVAILPPFSGG
jgi:molybdopterin synthase sulfur carrier subunit